MQAQNMGVVGRANPLLCDPKCEVQVIPNNHEHTGFRNFANFGQLFLAKGLDFAQNGAVREADSGVVQYVKLGPRRATSQ
jgi:hypothetical protein